MADEIVTRQQLVDAGLDAESLQKFISGLDSEDVLTRLGQIYPTLAKLVRILMETGGWKAYQTEAELLATTPMVNPSVGYAFDTKKMYLWNGTSWVNEGLSQLDQANIYTDQITGQVTKLIAEESGDKILIVRDSQGKPVFFITTSGRFYIPGLDNDVATKINALDFTRLINFDSGGNIFEVRDVNGSVSLRQLANGDLLLPKLGNLTNVIDELRSENADASNSINYLHRSARYTDYALADTSKPLLTYDYLLKASDVNAAAVFPHVVSYLRIPAITRIQKDKYLLFFEARADISDFSEISQGVATVTIDITTNVASVSNIKSLHNAFTEAGVLWTFMNACAVKIDSGRIICLYVQRNGTTQHKLLKRYSDDDGVTWSDFEDISSIYTSKGWNLLCPCSQGVLKRFGRNKGRIVFPTWTSGPAYNSSEFRAGYVYSDDGGQTFQLGAFANYTFASEVQCAEDLNGDLLFSVRIESQANPKIILKLKDGLDTYDQITPNVTLTAASVMSGLIQGDNRYDGSAAKFQLTACKNLNRTGLLIHTSYDGGLTWKTYEHPTVSSLAVAYTCIENLTPSKKFVLWESNVTRDFSYSIIGLKNLVEV
ncbi:exo-alpha-sialidase [Acinetobacter baumannii]|uniref:exo-alpha-sialidase n=1 Tax=Acinetobacter baumannii TaxID=470 RepID=UPI003B4347CA